MTKLIALDTETTGINLFQGDAPFAISTCDSEGATRLWEWPVNIHSRQPMPPSEELKELVDYIDGSTLIFHNAKFDLKFLIHYNIRVVNVWDTKIMHHFIDENVPKSLMDLVKIYFSSELEDL